MSSLGPSLPSCTEQGNNGMKAWSIRRERWVKPVQCGSRRKKRVGRSKRKKWKRQGGEEEEKVLQT